MEEFITYYTLNAPQIMWLLGAGASRSAGMPSATDIIWDLKRKFYCTRENQDITDNELSNEAIRKKIQSFLDSLNCPPMWSDDEYAYYFKLVLGDKPELHQKYLEEKLNKELVSINSGHKIIAALMAMHKAKLIFTTNFDEVIETAYASMTGKNLQAYNLNGSYAALNALNNENFPIYAKMHGDFRYFEMKNLPEQLKENDLEIEKCFINACSRYGMIVCGYSGRDKNVMNAFEKAIQNPNAFPKGLYWITSVQGNTFPSVLNLIEKAKSKGINAQIIEAHTFDALLNSIWKQIDSKPPEYDSKIRRSIFEVPRISKFNSNGNYPIIRTNAFPIVQLSKTCLSIEPLTPLTTQEFIEKVIKANSSAVVIKETSILCWGSREEIYKIIPENNIANAQTISIEDKLSSFRQNTLISSFYSRALSISAIRGKPLKLRRRKESLYAVISSKDEKFSTIEPMLKEGLATYNFTTKKMEQPQKLAGLVPGTNDVFWMECVEISIDYYDGQFYMMLVPDIWIEPLEKRQAAKDFITDKKKSRYNNVQNSLLDAWKKILLGNEKQITLQLFENETNNAIFTLNTTTAFSYRQTHE